MPKQLSKTTTKKTIIKNDFENPQQEAENLSIKKPTKSKSQYANKVLPYLTDIERYVRCGVTEGQICEFYGVGKTQWAQYKKEHPELVGALCKAKNDLKVNLINKSYEVAVGYEYIETTTVEYFDKDGVVTGSKTTTHKRYAKADAGMLQFLLINRFPAEFARDPQMIELRNKALQMQADGKIPFDAEGV